MKAVPVVWKLGPEALDTDELLFVHAAIGVRDLHSQPPKAFRHNRQIGHNANARLGGEIHLGQSSPAIPMGYRGDCASFRTVAHERPMRTRGR